MIIDRKYMIGCSGSGWGVWALTGEKIAVCRDRIAALEKWYALEGWSKPVRWY